GWRIKRSGYEMSSASFQREYWFGLQWVNAGEGVRQTQAHRMKQSYWTCLMGMGGGLKEPAGEQTERQVTGWVPSCWLNSRRTQTVLRLAQNGPSRARLTQVQAYSAAACMAAHHPQEAIFLLWTVAPGRLWFLVLEHGLVMEGSDCLLAQVGQVQTLRQA